MTKALSNLHAVEELAISIDSGLGWLSGPDVSDRVRLFCEKPEVFGRALPNPDDESVERENVWRSVMSSIASGLTNPPGTDYSSLYEPDIYEVGFFTQGIMEDITTTSWTPPRDGVPPFPYQPLLFDGVNLDDAPVAMPVRMSALMSYLGGDVDHGADRDANHGLFPSTRLEPGHLTTPQKEWLLETGWAQRAFLSSLCLALADNSETFKHVRVLKIARLSSKFLSSLRREDLWSALPNIESLTVNVSADWREIEKTDTDVVEAHYVNPSGAATELYFFLDAVIAGRRSIKSLSIGYVGGGEHQTGIFGRNKSILPAPLMDFSDPTVVVREPKGVLKLPYVEHLTLANCWITPATLKKFTRQLRSFNTRSITLSSVSLTADHGATNPCQEAVDQRRRPPLPSGTSSSRRIFCRQFLSDATSRNARPGS